MRYCIIKYFLLNYLYSVFDFVYMLVFLVCAFLTAWLKIRHLVIDVTSCHCFKKDQVLTYLVFFLYQI